MGHQIIEQPDGRYCVFSSGTDSILVYDATEAELVEYYAERAARDARRSTERLLDTLKTEGPRAAYFQFAVTFEEAVAENDKHTDPVPFEYLTKED